MHPTYTTVLINCWRTTSHSAWNFSSSGTFEAFLPKEPLKLLESVVLSDVPVMLAASQHEGSFLLGVAHVLELGPSGVLDDPVYVHDHLVGDLLTTWSVYEDKNRASIFQSLSTGLILQPRNNFTDIAYGLMPWNLNCR